MNFIQLSITVGKWLFGMSSVIVAFCIGIILLFVLTFGLIFVARGQEVRLKQAQWLSISDHPTDPNLIKVGIGDHVCDIDRTYKDHIGGPVLARKYNYISVSERRSDTFEPTYDQMRAGESHIKEPGLSHWRLHWRKNPTVINRPGYDGIQGDWDRYDGPDFVKDDSQSFVTSSGGEVEVIGAKTFCGTGKTLELSKIKESKMTEYEQKVRITKVTEDAIKIQLWQAHGADAFPTNGTWHCDHRPSYHPRDYGLERINCDGNLGRSGNSVKLSFWYAFDGDCVAGIRDAMEYAHKKVDEIYGYSCRLIGNNNDK